MKDMSKFTYRINDGPEQIITIKSGIYCFAVMAIMGTIDTDETQEPIKVEIWVPSLLPHYGPYKYLVIRNMFGNMEVGVLNEHSMIPDIVHIPLPGYTG